MNTELLSLPSVHTQALPDSFSTSGIGIFPVLGAADPQLSPAPRSSFNRVVCLLLETMEPLKSQSL